MSIPWDDLRLDETEQQVLACTSGDACTTDAFLLIKEVRRLRAQVKIAEDALEYITGNDVKGPARFPVTIAHDALMQMSVVE